MTATGAWTRAGATGILMVALCAPPLAAAPVPSAERRAEVFQQLVDCRTVADNTERLACYDKAAGALDQAEAWLWGARCAGLTAEAESASPSRPRGVPVFGLAETSGLARWIEERVNG